LQPGKELQFGRVSAAELVQAVHEMLSAAGINMDVEQQSLLHRTITLQEQLQDSRAAFLLEQEKADVAAKEADSAKAAWICRVCLSAEVNMTIVPCGHAPGHKNYENFSALTTPDSLERGFINDRKGFVLGNDGVLLRYLG
ncbi:hypothetical protein CFP56_005493, partial [Quercus suber]